MIAELIATVIAIKDVSKMFCIGSFLKIYNNSCEKIYITLCYKVMKYYVFTL